MNENTSSWRDWVGLVARLVIGGAYLYAGLVHVTHLDQNVLAVRAYRFGFLSYGMEQAIGYAQPVVEIVLGALLVTGLFTRISAALGALGQVVFIAAIISVWSRGLSIDCGCFSQGGETDDPNYLQHVIRDLVFLLAGLWLVWRPRSRWSLDGILRPASPENRLTTHDFDADEDALVGEDTPR